MGPDKIQWLMIVVSVGLTGHLVNLIRKRRLYERYAIIWLLAAMGMLFFSIFRPEINRVAYWFGVDYPPSLILVFAVLALVFIGLHFSLVLTRVKKDQARLVQEMALLTEKFEIYLKVSTHENGSEKAGK